MALEIYKPQKNYGKRKSLNYISVTFSKSRKGQSVLFLTIGADAIKMLDQSELKRCFLLVDKDRPKFLWVQKANESDRDSFPLISSKKKVSYRVICSWAGYVPTNRAGDCKFEKSGQNIVITLPE